MPKAIHCSIVATAEYQKQSNAHVKNWWNKLWYLYAVEYYTAVKKNKEDLYELIGRDFQNILLHAKSTMQRVSIVYYPSCKKEGVIGKYTHYLFICTKGIQEGKSEDSMMGQLYREVVKMRTKWVVEMTEE